MYTTAVSLVIGVLVLFLVVGLPRESDDHPAGLAGPGEPQYDRSEGFDAPGSDGPVPGGLPDDGGAASIGEADDRSAQSRLEADLEWLREDTTRDVLNAYSLMYQHLGLTDAEQRDLTAFLVEVWMSATSMGDYDPEQIGESDRRAGIAAIIGDAKLERLLELERHRLEYTETGWVNDLLRTNEVPLTAAQKEHLFDILVRVRSRIPAVGSRLAPADSVEAIEGQMDRMNEYERLVMELAPSVLSPRQTQLLFERYQSMWYHRAEILEKQKKSRSNDDETDDFPLVYPARR